MVGYLVLMIFQSALPLRGATPHGHARDRARNISIRAPLAGSDFASMSKPIISANFNPRSPCGERRPGVKSSATMTDFNPRSPCGERPQRHASHSPRADFNPRSPCGERLFSSMYEDGLPLFQSALPLRGATKASENASCNAIFQSALPLRGATSSRPVRGTSYIFQSALPLRGATRESPRCTCCRGISIRAPLAGSDVESGFRFRSRDDFNPRSPCGERHRFFGSCEDIVIFQSALPLRGATLHLVTLEGGHEISIRAPLAGSDAAPGNA